MRDDIARKLALQALRSDDARVGPLACSEGTEKAVAEAFTRWEERQKAKAKRQAEESRKRLKDEIKRRKES